MNLSSTDKIIINHLQGGFPVCEDPWAELERSLGIPADDIRQRIAELKQQGYVSRFGPMYHAEKLGGGLTLAAMAVEPDDFERVAAQVNAHDEVAHNYARDHRLNMWFVIATETPEAVDDVIHAIEQNTGLPVYNMPKLQEYFLGLKFEV